MFLLRTIESFLLSVLVVDPSSSTLPLSVVEGNVSSDVTDSESRWESENPANLSDFCPSRSIEIALSLRALKGITILRWRHSFQDMQSVAFITNESQIAALTPFRDGASASMCIGGKTALRQQIEIRQTSIGTGISAMSEFSNCSTAP